jgi:hypothetical protein
VANALTGMAAIKRANSVFFMAWRAERETAIVANECFIHVKPTSPNPCPQNAWRIADGNSPMTSDIQK